MSVQNRADNSSVPFIRSGLTFSKEAEIIAQDGGRSTALAKNTVMAQNATTKKWEPWTDIAATDGTAIPKGIYLGDEILAATLVAGDVVDSPMLVGGNCTVDTDQLVFENSLTLDTILATASIEARRSEDELNKIGIFPESTVDVDGFEN